MKQTISIILIICCAWGCKNIKTQSEIEKTITKRDSSSFFVIIQDTGTSIREIPCTTDTIKGRIFYHASTDQNYGNTWDYGYWIGKCGPAGGMNVDSLTFIPGVWKANRSNGLEYFYNEGFCDSRFKKIPAKDVYCMIILRY